MSLDSSADLEEVRLALAALTVRVVELERRLETAEVRQSRSEENFRPLEPFEVVTEPVRAENSASVVQASDAAGRRVLAEGIGGFLRRCLNGESRGSSGRDRLLLQNRVWVVLAGFDGRPLSEPRVETSYAPVRELCKRGPDCGRSIFVGLATKWEARIALEAAGVSIPSSLRDV
eukprot:Skav219692  [mRNA]  locus=scaffold817:180989:181513:+ [translate_table: standard]